jgi:hypothetical protein
VNSVDISTLSDDELLRRTERLAAQEREATVELVEHLAVIDDRELWKNKYGSMYEYCVYGLRLSDGAAYKRIRAARAVRRFPAMLEMMRDGRLSLAAVSMLHPHLEDPDAAALIVSACGLRIRKLEALLSVRCPQGARREVVRFIGSAPTLAPPVSDLSSEALPFDAVIDTVSPMFKEAVPPPPAPPPVLPPSVPPNPRLVRFAFTADEEFYLLLERVRALMRHKYPDGRLDGVLRDALRALLERKDPGIRWEMSRRRREKKTAPQ